MMGVHRLEVVDDPAEGRHLRMVRPAGTSRFASTPSLKAWLWFASSAITSRRTVITPWCGPYVL